MASKKNDPISNLKEPKDLVAEKREESLPPVGASAAIPGLSQIPSGVNESWQNAKVLFADQDKSEEVFHDRDLIQLFPYGLSLNGELSRPFLLLKDSTHEWTLPVAVNALEAGVTLSQSNKNQLPLSPHRFSQALLQSLDIQVVRCVFVEISGHHQFVRLYMMGHPGTNSLKLRADDAMSLCLQLGVPIYATRKFINKSRVMSADIESLQKQARISKTFVDRPPSYLM